MLERAGLNNTQICKRFDCEAVERHEAFEHVAVQLVRADMRGLNIENLKIEFQKTKTYYLFFNGIIYFSIRVKGRGSWVIKANYGELIKSLKNYTLLT
jgi:hypothetical protein